MASPRLPGRRSTFVHGAVPCLSVPHQQAVHHVVGKPPQQQRQGGGWGGCCPLWPRNYSGRWQNVNDSGKGWGWGVVPYMSPSHLSPSKNAFFFSMHPTSFISFLSFFFFFYFCSCWKKLTTVEQCRIQRPVIFFIKPVFFETQLGGFGGRGLQAVSSVKPAWSWWKLFDHGHVLNPRLHLSHLFWGCLQLI